MKVTNQNILSYKKNGYLLVNNVLKKNDLNLVEKVLNRLEKTQPLRRGVS